MDTISPDTLVADLVSAQPRYARIFEELGIDYCCGGERPLRKACAEQGLEPKTVVRMLSAHSAAQSAPDADAAPKTDWTRASLSDLITHIEKTHHAYLRGELPRLDELLTKVTHVHGADLPWLRRAKQVFDTMASDLYAHMEKEETVVFPFIRRLEDGEATAPPVGMDSDPMALMEHEHDEAGNALKELQALSNDFSMPRGACGTLRATINGLQLLQKDMFQHVHKENNILFRRARVLQ
ncbi:iron-sulfur cluster repair di-iron protein [Longimonas halophila]|uniref:Iron-sulfur cluster repair di-iron protein n=1 Tax=Longimonas halophila TaxID=1469170 RepID=A0A2H3P8E4_9BACT|nr:iron-sulfur cluster repair di-iron protein [Longimonas halophila]PEN07975.1 iron-sulfur cluster repair di-iron protein [Longimonas halophila]